MRRTSVLANVAAFYEFVDGNFLNNKRPAVPGGAWPLESLRAKSLADLQQIWFALVKERNMLATTKAHYLKHQEELGAMPAPSRLKMVEESMANLRQVVKERDREATAQATKVFKERLAKGVYRYPPGPSPPPGEHDTTSTVRLTLSRRVEPARLRELLGRYDVFAEHKGIVTLTVTLPEAVLQQKKEAEQLWQQYQTELSDTREYHKWAERGPSSMDYALVELAPGVFAGSPQAAEVPNDGEGEAAAQAVDSEGFIVAATLPVPPPKQRPPPPQNPLERIKQQRRSTLSQTVVQLGYFPNITQTAPRYPRVQDVPRPAKHPDEIEGPWLADVTYDTPDGLAFVQSLQLTSIDGAAVESVALVERPPQPFAEVDPVYREAVKEEMATEETMMKWPHVPEWKHQYDLYTKRHLAEIVQYNYSNVVDYVDREVLLTGKSVWECPIDIDATCGGMKSIPVHAKRPKMSMTPGLREVGVTDI